MLWNNFKCVFLVFCTIYFENNQSMFDSQESANSLPLPVHPKNSHTHFTYRTLRTCRNYLPVTKIILQLKNKIQTN